MSETRWCRGHDGVTIEGVVTDARWPLQGGLPPVGAIDGAVVEIACDESGFSGSNLLDASTPLFTHAGVDLDVDEAADLIGELRSGLRWTHAELKSGPFLRDPRAGLGLRLLLERLEGRAQVHVVDKELFLVTRIVDLFLAEPSYAAGTRLTQDQRPAALALHRAGRTSGRVWTELLASFALLVRTKRRAQSGTVARFLAACDALRDAGLDADARTVLDDLRRPRVEAVVGRIHDDDRLIPPPLEPVLPALADTVLSWSDGRRRVLVVHDEQSALTAGRLLRLQQALGEGAPVGGASPLAGLVSVDSRHDPRVQVADLLAGVARRVPGADALTPFVSPTSLVAPRGRADGAPHSATVPAWP